MKDEALEFTSGHIYSQTHISRGGLILFALLSGNDYNVPGVANCDPGIALALIQLGYGHELSDAITNHLRVPHVDVDEIDFNFFIIEWRERICHELRTNPHHCFDSCLPEIADIIESTGFPNRRLLEYYVAPITTLLFTINPDPWYQFCEPSLCDIAIFCQRYLHWSPASALERNLLQVVFPSVILRMMHLPDTVYDHKTREMTSSTLRVVVNNITWKKRRDEYTSRYGEIPQPLLTVSTARLIRLSGITTRGNQNATTHVWANHRDFTSAIGSITSVDMDIGSDL
ncbi:hypothetical protein BJ165DRAFT_1468006 [Panaeolus papilionaceus]|nr:hypothetical protein BJ165DRAFT_1468006 [Panaeolus papilionaceus]